MVAFVLVPGAWLGGWCWRRVSPLLRNAGHDVYAIILTGLGERVHLGTPDTGLNTHILDVSNVLTFEDLREVVLIGHSYSGFVISGVAEQVPERLTHLVYLAANVPTDGQSLFDGWSSSGRAAVEEEARVGGDGWRWPLPDDLGAATTGLTDADERWLRAKAVGHPLRTFAQSVRLTNPAAAPIPRTDIQCTTDGSRLPGEVQQSGAAGRWWVRELATGHWPMLSAPRDLVDLLLNLV
ncbi:MAG: alpha/beta fold hydrolase [Chloroflexi bacterium]|nr:alpha/beta fold hydrolase [Chloroflexota bacterium]